VGPHRDLLGDLQTADKDTVSPMTDRALRFGVYHSLLEFFHPLYMQDKANNFTTHTFVDKPAAELYDLVQRYEADLIWSDGAWEADSTYWNATDFLTWLVHNSTVKDHVVYNDRWGHDTKCRHGSFWTCQDRYDPDALQAHKWENACTIDQTSWEYNRDYLNVTSLVHTLVKVVALNGNLLLNIGPRADGTLDPIFVHRLTEMGDWLKVNGPAINSSQPWSVCQNETIKDKDDGSGAVDVYYASRDDIVYAILTSWPADNRLRLICPSATNETNVRMLGVPTDNSETTVSWNEPMAMVGGLDIQLPNLTPNLVPC